MSQTSTEVQKLPIACPRNCHLATDGLVWDLELKTTDTFANEVHSQKSPPNV